MEELMTKNIKYESAELIEKLCITQIKQILKKRDYREYEKAIFNMVQELNKNNFKNKKIYFNSKIINIIIALSQVNTFIWLKRHNIQVSNNKLNNQMKISHQLNAIRNILKNKLMEQLGHKTSASIKTNINKEDLKGWRYSIAKK